MQLTLHYLNYPREPARSEEWRHKHAFLIVHFGGLKSARMPGREILRDEPFLALTLPGEPLTFEYTAKRDEWILSFESADLRPARAPSLIEARFDDRWVALPRYAPLPADRIAFWREEGRRMMDAYAHPTPAGQARLQLGFMTALCHLLDHRRDRLGETPAGRLKALINDPTLAGLSLAELSRRCGYATDYLSSLFHREYHISPVVYRNRMRMWIARDLIATTRLPAKEIAKELGFRHVSHFSAQFKKIFGFTAREAIRRYRK